MILQHSHRRHAAAPTAALNPSRILGISSTLAINLLAMLMLMVPTQLPPPIALAEPEMQFQWIEPKKPDPPIPETVQVVQKPRTTPTPATKPQLISPPVQHPITFDDGELAYTPTVDPAPADTGPADIGPSVPVQGMRLEYAITPPPAYPRDALRQQLQGTVTLQVLVDVDGKPLEVDIHTSSGHRSLDREAVRHVLRHWTFQPATKDGRAVQAIGLVPIEFTLDRM